MCSVSYSCPIQQDDAPGQGCASRIFTAIRLHPDWIPYRTSYYQENWGFCLTALDAEGLTGRRLYGSSIRSSKTASVIWGEVLHYQRRDLRTRIVISTHICHPSLAGDNLNGHHGFRSHSPKVSVLRDARRS